MNHKIEKSSVPPLAKLRQHHSKNFSRGFLSVRIALEMEAARVQGSVRSAGSVARHTHIKKSKEEMQIGARCKTRIPGRPGEGAAQREQGRVGGEEGVLVQPRKKTLPIGVVAYHRRAPLSGI